MVGAANIILISQAEKQETFLPLWVMQVFCMKASMVFSIIGRNQENPSLVQSHKAGVL